jgi:hypothetical protein
MSVQDLLEYWYQAFASKVGIVVAVSDVNAARQKLYQARTKSGDPDLDGVSIRVSPVLPTEELWLIKQPPKSKESPNGTAS